MPMPPISIQCEPNWSTIWTAEEAEKQLTNFKFNGPGWYLSKGDAILVIPVDEPAFVQEGGRWNIWRARWPKHKHFRFMVFNGRQDAAPQSFAAIAHAPIREDDRE